jgi:hypothetical protein
VRRPRHHTALLRAEQPAVVERLHLGELGDSFLDPVGDRVQDGGPLRGRRGRPGRERVPGGVHRRVDFGRAAAGDLGDRALVNGGQVGEGAGRADPLAADPVSGVDVDFHASTFPPSQVTPTCR